MHLVSLRTSFLFQRRRNLPPVLISRGEQFLTLLDIVDKVHRWLNLCQHINFWDDFISDNGGPSTPYLIMNITSSCFKFTTPFCHVLPVHNIFAVNRNKLAINFSSSFSFRVKKSNYCTNLTFGEILNRHNHFKQTCEYNVAVTVAGELCPVIRFLSHMAALQSLKKNIYPLQVYWTCIFTFRISLVHGQ
jgi:hypothetical protein